MKVLHLVAGEISGGAARGALWLHEALLLEGINSTILTTSRETLDHESIKSINNNLKNKFFSFIRSHLDLLLLTLLYRNRKPRIFSTGYFGYDFTKTKEYLSADVIHLHWVNGGFVRIKNLHKINKPIVWTIRDMWPMTGGCHYSLDCSKYISGCGKCPQLNSEKNNDLSKKVIRNKSENIPKHTKIVGISQWVSDECRKSYLFKDFDIRTIPNNVNVQSFSGIDQNIAKSILGIETNKKIILIGANSVADFYKGFNKFLDALTFLSPDDYYICIFGNHSRRLLAQSNFEFKALGYLSDDVTLRLAYSCADLFVAPSVMEAFGKTLVESMSCGTPVVCFDSTGPRDIVDHKENGYKAIPFDAQDLANGIAWIANNPNPKELSRKAREKSLEIFDSLVIAKKYIELYKDILEK